MIANRVRRTNEFDRVKEQTAAHTQSKELYARHTTDGFPFRHIRNIMKLNRNRIDDLTVSLLGEVAGTEHESYLASMRGRYGFLLMRLSETVSTGKVLDVGSSPGLFTELIRRAGYDTVGLDLNPHKRFPPAAGGLSKNLFLDLKIPVVGADAVQAPFPFKDNSFDAVMLNETIEHFIGSPLSCLNEIRRVLRPGGSLFLTTPNVVALSNRIRMLAGLNIYTPVEILVNVTPYKLHNREYAMYELEDLLLRANFTAEEKRHVNLGGVRLSGVLKVTRDVYYAITLLYPQFRTNLYVRAVPKNK